MAADKARDAGKKEFEFPEGSGKMHKVTIKKDLKVPKKKVKDVIKELAISDLKIKEFSRIKIGE